MPRHLALVLPLLGLMGLPASAQLTYTRSMIPTRSSMERLGLEKNWVAATPLGLGSERIQRLSLAHMPPEDSTILFVQSSGGSLHAFDGESGRFLWSAELGHDTALSFAASINSDRVFVTNDNHLYCLDRSTGRLVWRQDLERAAASPTACDEERVVVGLDSGKVVAYAVRDHTGDKGGGLSAGRFLWAWQTQGKVTGHPLPAQKVVAFGSQDSRVYVALMNKNLTEKAKLVFRFLTGGPISATMGELGTRTLLVPSQDHNLYAIDLFDGTTRWIHATGAPLEQEPLVAQTQIFVQNIEGKLTALDGQTESDADRKLWEVQAGKAQLLAVGPNRVYAQTETGDLAIAERNTGRILFNSIETSQRAGLNLHGFDHALTNRVNDRIYLATSSGLIYCMREIGQVRPNWLRDPNGPEFGSLPDAPENVDLNLLAPEPGAQRDDEDAFKSLGELPAETNIR